MYSLEGIVLIQSSSYFVWMCVVIKSRPEFKMGHVGSKTRSLCQFLEKPCVLSRRHSFDPVFMKLCQNDFLTLNKHLSRRAMLSDDSSCCPPTSVVMGSSVRPSVRRHNLVSASPPTVFKGFWWNFPVIVPMTWGYAYFTEVMLNWFLPELWPFNNFSTVSHVFPTPLAVFSWF